MDRRNFLKGTVGLSAAGVTTLLLQPGLQVGTVVKATSTAVQAQVMSRLLRGTRDGQIFESVDAGNSWQRIAKFGQHCAIVAIRESQRHIYTDIDVQGYHFSVRSADARLWRTVNKWDQ